MPDVNIQIQSNRIISMSIEKGATVKELREALADSGYDTRDAEVVIHRESGEIITGEIENKTIKPGDFVNFATLEVSVPGLDAIFDEGTEEDEDGELTVSLITPSGDHCTFVFHGEATVGDILSAESVLRLFKDADRSLCADLTVYNGSDVPVPLREAFANTIVADGDVLGINREFYISSKRKSAQHGAKITVTVRDDKCGGCGSCGSGK